MQAVTGGGHGVVCETQRGGPIPRDGTARDLFDKAGHPPHKVPGVKLRCMLLDLEWIEGFFHAFKLDDGSLQGLYRLFLEVHSGCIVVPAAANSDHRLQRSPMSKRDYRSSK